jgi:peptide/nickel transport system substrate-binding protein
MGRSRSLQAGAQKQENVVGLTELYARKLREKVGICAAGALVFVTAASCSTTDSSTGTRATQGGTINVVIQAAPDSIDPAISYTTEGWDFSKTAYDGLMAFKNASGASGNQVAPDLAIAMPRVTDNGLVYTYYLRKGIRFSNGVVVTASDFLLSMERLWKVNSPSPYYRNIVGANLCNSHPDTCNLDQGIQVDDSTGAIAIHLTSPDGALNFQLAMPFASVLPASAPDKAAGVIPIPGTGPYEIRDYSPSTGLTLDRNPFFKQWSSVAQPAGVPDKIVWHWGLTLDAEVAEVKNGGADIMLDTPPGDLIQQLSSQYPTQFYDEPSLGLYFLSLNTSIAPFNNLQARQALNFAIDRNAIVKLFGGTGLATPTCQVIPPDMLGGSPPYCPYTSGSTTSGMYSGPDLARAQQLVKASGTVGASVHIFVQNTAPFTFMGEYLQTVVRSLGYRPVLSELETGVYWNVVANSSNHPNIAMNDVYPDYPLASNMIPNTYDCSLLIPDSDSNGNYSFWCNKQINTEITNATATEGVEGVQAAEPAWHQILKNIVDQAPVVPLTVNKFVFFVSSAVSHVVYNEHWTILLDQLHD